MMRSLLTAGLGLLVSLSAIAPADAFYIPGKRPDLTSDPYRTPHLHSY